MRLIATLQDEKQSVLLSDYLKSQNIDNLIDVSPNSHWEDSNYGVPSYTIWVIEEENLLPALEIARDFVANHEDPRFVKPSTPQLDAHQAADLYELTPEATDKNVEIDRKAPLQASLGRSEKVVEPLGKATLYLLMICSLIFIFSEIGSPTPSQAEAIAFSKQSLPLMPLYYSKINKELLFDYPHAYEIVDSLIAKSDLETMQASQQLPSDLQPLVNQFHATPYWQGYYDKIVAFFIGGKTDWQIDTPVFEKIQKGEFWRLISPIFLHADIFHLLFNMIWLGLLGKQLESRMGWARFLLFVAAAGVITNICQYLMTGSNFLGFSGVVCALITFVWMRQRKAPWEGYLLQSITFNFALLFLFVIILLQLASFYTEVFYGQPIAPQIANTAHMVGLLIGLLFGNFNFFAWRH